MRVVITHTDLRIYWPARIKALQLALETRGDELHIIEIAGAGSNYAFSKNPSGPAVDNWTVLFPTAKMEELSSLTASNALIKKLNELSPDVVMAGSIAYPSGAAAAYWAKKHHRSVIIFDDIRLGDTPRNPVVNFVKRTIYQQVDAILCPAEPWIPSFQHWGFRREQLFFGVDVVDNDFWQMHSIPPAEGYLLAVGRQIPSKNFPFLLKAYAAYQASCKGRHLPLVLVGDGPERKSIEALTSKLKDVHLYPFATPEKLRECYQQASALILPSQSETWGLVVNEAMAAGLPVLVSNACGCVSVLVEEAVNGYTFSPDGHDELVDVLMKFTGMDNAARKAMGEASKKIVKNWGLDRFVTGSLGSIDYSAGHRKTTRSMHARLALRHWKGRYRPV